MLSEGQHETMKPFIIAINATAGGGKTTTTRELQKRLPNAKALYFDDRDYDVDSGIIDIEKWIADGADVNLWDLKRLAEDIDNLKTENLDFIVLDYPFSYRHNLIGAYLNYSVFIDTPLDITLARRILRDYDRKTLICKWNEEDDKSTLFDDMSYYLKNGRNPFIYGIEKGKADADLILDGSLELDKIVQSICEKVLYIRVSDTAV